MPVQLIDRYSSCGVYHPYRIMGERNPNCDHLTYKMMDLKNPDCPNHKQAVEFFSNLWIKELVKIRVDGLPLASHKFNIAVIPKHEQGLVSQGLMSIVSAAFQEFGQKPPPPIILNRKYTVPSSHNGGGRSMAVHLNSIEVNQRVLVKGIPTVLLDDVKTTGVSMSACSCLLKQAGSGVVIPMPLLETA